MSTAVFGAPEFRARSGRTVSARSDGSVMFDHANGYLSPASVMDAEEFFQHERDKELGRWRWPENPDYVVKHDPLGVRIAHVLHEPSFAARVVRPSDETVGLGSPRDMEFLGAARAYFDSHPEPKAWHDAKPEEVWLMGSGLHEFVALVSVDGKFRFADGSDMAVTEEFATGRRIWPEDAS